MSQPKVEPTVKEFITERFREGDSRYHLATLYDEYTGRVGPRAVTPERFRWYVENSMEAADTVVNPRAAHLRDRDPNEGVYLVGVERRTVTNIEEVLSA